MKPREKTRTGRQAARAGDLFESARAQPGVATLMRVYRQCRKIQQTSAPYTQVVARQPIVSASNTSRPNPW